MESHGREKSFKETQPFYQDQSMRASKGREVGTMVYGGTYRVPTQEVPNTKLMEPSFGRTIDRGLDNRLRTTRPQCCRNLVAKPPPSLLTPSLTPFLNCHPSSRGDFHHSLETKAPTATRAHMMRVTALENVHMQLACLVTP